MNSKLKLSMVGTRSKMTSDSDYTLYYYIGLTKRIISPVECEIDTSTFADIECSVAEQQLFPPSIEYYLEI